MPTVTFNGASRIISVNASLTTIDTKVNLYSEWKAWVMAGNAQWPAAFRVIGGDPIGGGILAGAFFFLQNQLGWRIRPDTNLDVTGNLEAEDIAQPIFIPSLSTGTFTIRQIVSSLTEVVAIGGGSGGLTTAQAAQLMGIPQNPVLVTDSRLANLDVPVSSVSGGGGGVSTQGKLGYRR